MSRTYISNCWCLSKLHFLVLRALLGRKYPWGYIWLPYLLFWCLRCYWSSKSWYWWFPFLLCLYYFSCLFLCCCFVLSCITTGRVSADCSSHLFLLNYTTIVERYSCYNPFFLVRIFASFIIILINDLTLRYAFVQHRRWSYFCWWCDFKIRCWNIESARATCPFHDFSLLKVREHLVIFTLFSWTLFVLRAV